MLTKEGKAILELANFVDIGILRGSEFKKLDSVVSCSGLELFRVILNVCLVGCLETELIVVYNKS